MKETTRFFFSNRSSSAATFALRIFLPSILVVGVFTACSSHPTPLSPPQLQSNERPEVLVYVNSRCPYCSRARAFMDTEGISYEARDVRADAKAKAEFRAMGGSAVPLFIIGHTQVRGLDKVRVRELVYAERKMREREKEH